MTRVEPTYRERDQLASIAEHVIEGMAKYPGDESDLPSREGGICKVIGAPPPASLRGRYFLEEEHDPGKFAADIRQAPVFFFGGLFHDSINDLGGIIAPIRRANIISSDRIESFHKALLFCPKASRADRIRTAYQWNADKSGDFAYQVKNFLGGMLLRLKNLEQANDQMLEHVANVTKDTPAGADPNPMLAELKEEVKNRKRIRREAICAVFNEALGEYIQPPITSEMLDNKKALTLSLSLAMARKYPGNPDKMTLFLDEIRAHSGGLAIDNPLYHPTTISDVKEFTDQLWNHRFCDDQKRLLPSNQFNGFSFVTYSIGGRLAFMVENLLREKLRHALRTKTAETGSMNPQEENDAIQQYFNKCKTICIGHGLDWRDAPENTPVIPKLFLIGKEDKGVIYHQSFYDFMGRQKFGERKNFHENSGILCDISKQFHAPKGSHKVVILKHGILESVRGENSTTNSHGLPDYTRVLETYRDNPAVHYFIEELNNAIQKEQSRPRPASTFDPPRLGNGEDSGGRAAGAGM